VHALGQVVHVDLDERIVAKWRRDRLSREAAGAARQVPEPPARTAIAVIEARWLPTVSTPVTRRQLGVTATACSARRGRPVGAPLLVACARHPRLGAMRIGTDALLGEHDFSAFCRLPHGESAPIIRRVLSAGWSFAPGDDRLWFLRIEANAFCHQMVRSVVGTLVASGRDASRPASCSRSSAVETGLEAASPPLPRLCLMGVEYPDSLVPGGTWQPGQGDWATSRGEAPACRRPGVFYR